jgi:hypothetical protein
MREIMGEPKRACQAGRDATSELRAARGKVRTAFELGWSTQSNGELLTAAGRDVDVLVTTDRNLQREQPMTGRRLTILVFPTTSGPRIQGNIDTIVRALASIVRGQYLELTW